MPPHRRSAALPARLHTAAHCPFCVASPSPLVSPSLVSAPALTRQLSRPQDLVAGGLYSAPAVELYPHPHRDVSLALVAKTLGAVRRTLAARLSLDRLSALSTVETARSSVARMSLAGRHAEKGRARRAARPLARVSVRGVGNARSSAGDWEPRGGAPRLGRSDSSLSWWGESDTESGRRSEGGAESRV